MEYSKELFERLNTELPCPPFEESDWSSDCVSWFKDSEQAQEWISIFRDLVAILEDSDIEVGTLTAEDPGMIVYEDEYQVVAESNRY